MTALRSFLPSELVLAAGLAVIIEGGLFILLVTASNKTHITARDPMADKPIPIEVKPVLDEMPPLLKLGSKKMRAKLPDMWKAKPPVKKFEAASAPSPKAEATKEKIPESPVVKKDKEAPPPDAAIVKKADEQPKTEDTAKPVEQNLPEEGDPGGVKEGTETDPLKAFAVSQYRIKISNWFNSRFKRPDIPCDELKKLKASVVASISGDRTVSGYTVSRVSGNSTFDDRVKSTLDSIVSSGSELPPPPPNYSDILGASLPVTFAVYKCD